MNPSDSVRILVGWCLDDLRDGARGILRNTVAASAAVPRVLRFAIYRLLGVRTSTPNILPHLTIVGPSSNLTIGAGTFVNGHSFFECIAPVQLGSGCLVGMQVMIVTSDHRRSAEGFEMAPAPQPVRIGDRVWIGARATILPGVTVHDDVIIAAGSVVTKDCAPFGIYAGVPARRIKEYDGSRGVESH